MRNSNHDRRNATENLTNGKADEIISEQVGAVVDEWLTTEEAAAYLKISAHTLRNLTSNGRVPYYKWQSRNRYLKSDLRKLLMSNKRGGI